MDIEKILTKVNEILPSTPAVRLTVEKGETNLFDSKIGGTPYFPKDMEYPRGKKNIFEGQPLTLLAQLNFEKLPHIPDFPATGILQFFIAADELYGMSPDYKDLTRQDNFRVIYHKSIITEESKLLSANEIPKYSGSDECYLPFTGEYKLTAHELEMMPANLWDYRFSDAFIKCYNEFSGESAKDFWDIDYEIIDKLYDMIDFPDAVVGGYPIFTQDDPRMVESLSDCDVLLFELDSVYNNNQGIDILWGDMGTGSFMIPHSRLKDLDFSRVLYNYDCS